MFGSTRTTRCRSSHDATSRAALNGRHPLEDHEEGLLADHVDCSSSSPAGPCETGHRTPGQALRRRRHKGNRKPSERPAARRRSFFAIRSRSHVQRDEPVRLSAGVPGEAQRTGQVVLVVGGERLPLELTVPAGPVTVEQLLPILRGLSSLFSDAARPARGRGPPDLLPRRLRRLLPPARPACRRAKRAPSPASSTRMPEPRRSVIRGRFEEALEEARSRGPARPYGHSHARGALRAGEGLFPAGHRLPLPRGRILLDPSRPADGLPRVSRHLAGRKLPHAAGRQDREGDARGRSPARPRAGRGRRLGGADPRAALPRRDGRAGHEPRGTGHPARGYWQACPARETAPRPLDAARPRLRGSLARAMVGP